MGVVYDRKRGDFMKPLYLDGMKINTKEELHAFIKNKLQNEHEIYLDKLIDEDLMRGKKKTQEDSGPKHVHLKFMFPFKLELRSGSSQMILGVIVDKQGHPIRNAIVDFYISDYDLGNLSFSPAISFGDGSFFTTFKAECPGEGCLFVTAHGTDLKKEIPIKVC